MNNTDTNVALFPSPLGSFFISMMRRLSLIMVAVGFRPLWGSFLFLYRSHSFYQTPICKFPSPMGIFFISIIPAVYKRDNHIKFPSPMGIFFISISNQLSYTTSYTVSVPYGDLFYFYPVLWKPYRAWRKPALCGAKSFLR